MHLEYRLESPLYSSGIHIDDRGDLIPIYDLRTDISSITAAVRFRGLGPST